MIFVWPKVRRALGSSHLCQRRHSRIKRNSKHSRKSWKRGNRSRGDAWCGDQDGRTAAAKIRRRTLRTAPPIPIAKEFLFSQSNNDRQLLQMVEGALGRIREGTFGEYHAEKKLTRSGLNRGHGLFIECQEKLEKGELEPADDFHFSAEPPIGRWRFLFLGAAAPSRL